MATTARAVGNLLAIRLASLLIIEEDQYDQAHFVPDLAPYLRRQVEKRTASKLTLQPVYCNR
jgi:hypothetical protein